MLAMGGTTIERMHACLPLVYIFCVDLAALRQVEKLLIRWEDKPRIGSYIAGLCRPILLACIFIALLFSQPDQVAAQASATANKPGVHGRIVDASGNAVSAATVTLRSSDNIERAATTDASGHFTITVSSTGSYQLHASKAGVESPVRTLTITGAGRQDLVVVLPRDSLEVSAIAPSSEQAMEFSDKPNFTIAGVTDWTAAGGHGSDATLRASEDVTRTSLAPASGGPAGREVGGPLSASQREQEAGLSADLLANPDSYAANHKLGEFYLHAARFTQAAPLLKKAAGLPEARPEDEYDLALACRGLGDLAQARQHITRALASNDEAAYHALAGQLAEAAGDPVRAAQQFERAARLSPSESSYFAWGAELLSHRAIWQAAEVFTSGIKLFPASVHMKIALGAALFAVAHYKDAEEQLCIASDLEPANAEAYLLIGKVMLAAPEPLTCVQPRLERFLAILPLNADAHYFLAMLALKQNRDGNYTRSTALLQQALKLDPKYAEAYLQLGILAFRQRSYADAIQLYKEAISADPLQAEAHYRLGVTYDRTGQPLLAKEEFQRHDQIEKSQAEVVEQQRRQIKQFVVLLQSKPAGPAVPQ